MGKRVWHLPCSTELTDLCQAISILGPMVRKERMTLSHPRKAS